MTNNDNDHAVFIDNECEGEIEQLSIWFSKDEAVDFYRNSLNTSDQLLIVKRVDVDIEELESK